MMNAIVTVGLGIIIAVVIVGIIYVEMQHTNTTTSIVTTSTTNSTTSIATQALSANVSISSYSCTKGTNGVYNLHLTGTASGPAWSSLLITDFSRGTPSCSAWGSKARSADAQALNYPCYRGINDPASTNWTANEGLYTNDYGLNQQGGTLSILVLVNVFANITSYGDVTVDPVKSGEATNNSYIATEAQANVTVRCS